MIRHLRFILFVTFTTAAASILSLVGGIGLEAVSEQLLPLVPLIVAVPALNNMVGTYASVIAAHAADPEERVLNKKQLAHALTKTIWLNILAVIVLSLLVAYQRDYMFTAGFLYKFILFISLAIVGVVASIFALTTLLDKLLERRRLNPDDILIPIVTSLADVMMLVLIALAAYFLF